MAESKYLMAQRVHQSASFSESLPLSLPLFSQLQSATFKMYKINSNFCKINLM